MNINQAAMRERSHRHKHIRLKEKDIIIYREVSSTNTVAQMMALKGAHEGTIVMSTFQTSGKGRMQRQWVCPPGKGIMMSMILRPKLNSRLVPQLTLLSGVVVAETIRKVTQCKAGIKWPNDIVIGGKKVCGILAQSNISSGTAGFVIMGIGINVNQDENQLPPDCKDTSTSLKIELGRRLSRLNVLSQFISIWEKHYQRFLKMGYPYLRRKWIENNVTLGRYISINSEESPKGLAIDISERGGLLVSLPDGLIKEFLAEDLSLGRSYYQRESVIT
ncbi:MAG: biotin--[acetyl-CoA-carboxylase] ligase [Clostridia bacterium]|nr:biotin--[acetyl-CoA-carboxylase] ligase [Clostridia bacterium]